MLYFEGENGMSKNHTSETSIYLIKYTDGLYVRGVSLNGVTLVHERRNAYEYIKEELNHVKTDVEAMIKLGLKKDNIFVVEESEMVVKKETEMTVDSFISEPAPEKEECIIQDVWELRD